jgi:hypothetical protein
VLEENYCFDAESYADELQLEEQIEFKEDHRSMHHLACNMTKLTESSQSGQMDIALPFLELD